MTDIRPENRVGLSLSLKRGRLLIYYATIRALGDPGFIRFLVNSKERHLAVQTCEEIDGNNFKVPTHVPGEDYCFEICSTQFVSILYKTCGWDPDKTYMVYGKLHAKHRLVDFDLNTAREISSDQFADPENL